MHVVFFESNQVALVDGVMHLPNPLHPDRMTSAERRAAILARGIIRRRLRDATEVTGEKEKIRTTLPARAERACEPVEPENRMTNPILTRLAALKTTPTPELKRQWRELFDSEPPAFNRRYLESRLACRLQELACGGFGPETLKRFEVDTGHPCARPEPADPVAAADAASGCRGFARREAGRRRGRRPSPRTAQVHAKILPHVADEIADEARRRGVTQGVVLEEAWALYVALRDGR